MPSFRREDGHDLRGVNPDREKSSAYVEAVLLVRYEASYVVTRASGARHNGQFPGARAIPRPGGAFVLNSSRARHHRCVPGKAHAQMYEIVAGVISTVVGYYTIRLINRLSRRRR